MITMSAALQFTQTFSGVSTQANPINSTINTAAIVSSIQTGMLSQLTSDVQPANSLSFYAQPNSITSSGKRRSLFLIFFNFPFILLHSFKLATLKSLCQMLRHQVNADQKFYFFLTLYFIIMFSFKRWCCPKIKCAIQLAIDNLFERHFFALINRKLNF